MKGNAGSREATGAKPSTVVRAEMTEFCLREFANVTEPAHAYIAALTSAAHLCDQIAREATRKAEKVAAAACGDFIWQVADRIKAERRDRPLTAP